MKKIFVVILLLTAQSLFAQLLVPALPPDDKIRIISFNGSSLTVGVSTAKVQFGLQTSTNLIDWKEVARTWILYSGTKEAIINLPTTTQMTFVRLVK